MVAGDPDLGEYTSPTQQPVGFGMYHSKITKNKIDIQLNDFKAMELFY